MSQEARFESCSICLCSVDCSQFDPHSLRCETKELSVAALDHRPSAVNFATGLDSYYRVSTMTYMPV